jgi:hypothetical protein
MSLFSPGNLSRPGAKIILKPSTAGFSNEHNVRVKAFGMPEGTANSIAAGSDGNSVLASAFDNTRNTMQHLLIPKAKTLTDKTEDALNEIGFNRE